MKIEGIQAISVPDGLNQPPPPPGILGLTLWYVQAGKSYYGAARPGIELGSNFFEIHGFYVITYQRT